MSYDIYLLDPVTRKTIQLDANHDMRGGTYCLGGTRKAWLNITYNYSEILYSAIDGGVRGLYGKTGAETIPMLETAIAKLGDDVADDYWKPTEGNVKRALCGLLALARLRPDGIWDGD